MAFKHRRNKPFFGYEEINSIIRVMNSGMVHRGDTVTEFEDEFLNNNLTPDKAGAVGVSSCTAALFLALKI